MRIRLIINGRSPPEGRWRGLFQCILACIEVYGTIESEQSFQSQRLLFSRFLFELRGIRSPQHTTDWDCRRLFVSPEHLFCRYDAMSNIKTPRALANAIAQFPAHNFQVAVLNDLTSLIQSRKIVSCTIRI